MRKNIMSYVMILDKWRILSLPCVCQLKSSVKIYSHNAPDVTGIPTQGSVSKGWGGHVSDRYLIQTVA